MSELVCVRGVVASGTVTLVKLVVEGKRTVRARRPADRLVLTLEDSSHLTVEVPEEARLEGEPTRVAGAWSELRESAEARGLERDLAQPFARVELSRLAIEPGAPVVVWGEITGQAFAEGGGPREAPSQRPSALRARGVAAGPDAELRARREIDKLRAVVRRQAPRRKRVVPTDPGDPATPAPLAAWWGAAVVSLIAIGIAVRAAVAGGPGAPATALMLAAAIAAVAFAIRPVRIVPDFWRRTDKIQAGHYGLTVLLPRSLLGAGMGALVLFVFAAPLPFAASLGVLVFLGGWALTVLLDDRPSHRTLATLVGARHAAPAGAEGQWVTFEGVVRDPTPVVIAGDQAALGVVSKMKCGIGDSPDELQGRAGASEGTFVIDVDGTELEVDPEETTWATQVSRRPADTSIGYHSYDIEEWIPVGGRVAASGLVARDASGKLHLRSSGTRPAILLATSAAGHPLALARAMRRHRQATLGVLALAAAIVIALHVLWR